MFAVTLGLMAVLPTLGLYVEERFGLNGEELHTWTGWVYGAAPLTAALVGPLWGVAGDRLGRKMMVVRASLAIGVATALMPFASTPGGLLALRVLQGAFAGFVAPAMVLGTAGIPTGRQGHALGQLQGALALGLLAGPLIGGEVAFHFGRAAVFYFTSAMALLAVLPVLVFAREDDAELLREPSPGSLPGRVARDLGELLASRVFVALLSCLFLLRFGQHMVEPYIALWVRQMGAHPAMSWFESDPDLALERTIAVSFGVLAVAQLLCTGRWGRLADRIGPMRCLATVGLGLALVFFVTATTTTIEGFLLLRCCAAVFMAGGMTLAYAAVARRVRPERKALAFSFVQSGMQLGLALGPVVGSAVAGSGGMPGMYWMGGLCLVVAGVGMFILRAAEAPVGAVSEEQT